MIASICSNPKVLEVMRYINIFITIIRIVVPILLIFSLTFKLIKAVTSGNEDGLSKVKKNAPSNIIAAVVIFLIPSIVSLIVKVSFPNSDYKNCLDVKNNSQINIMYNQKAESLISIAEKTLNTYDYTNALNYLKNIKDENKRQEYENKLKSIEDKIYIKEADNLVKSAEKSLNESDILAASIFLKNINDAAEKEKITKRLSSVEDKVQEKIKKEEEKNPTGSLPGGDMVYIPPGQRPIMQYVNIDSVNQKIASAVMSKGLYTREGVVAAAETLIKTLESKNYYIPYQLGGMFHRGNAWGVNPIWGTYIKHDGKDVLSGLDCRNFVNWAFKQAGLSLIRGFGYEGSLTNDGDNKYANINEGRPGDVIDAAPHIMLVVENKGSSYLVAESNGVGRVRLQEFTNDVLAGAGYSVYNMDAVYENTGKYCPMESSYRAYSGSCHIPRSEFPKYY